MSDLFPLLFAVLLTALLFTHAMKHGVVRPLASAFAASAAFFVFFGGVRFLPELAESVLRIEISWSWSVGASIGAAFCVYVLVLVLVGWLLKTAFAHGGWFHWMGHGVLGGILSLFPSAVAVFFLFWCARAGGTLIELNYVALVSRPDIENYAGGIRPMPFPVRWRDTVEAVPFAARLFDGIDPFSNRAHRNAAALAVMQTSPVLSAFLLGDPETESLLDSPSVQEAIRDAAVLDLIHSGDRIGLVLSPQFRALAEDREIAPELRRMRPDPILRRFASHLEAVATGGTPEFQL